MVVLLGVTKPRTEIISAIHRNFEKFGQAIKSCPPPVSWHFSQMNHHQSTITNHHDSSLSMNSSPAESLTTIGYHSESPSPNHLRGHHHLRCLRNSRGSPPSGSPREFGRPGTGCHGVPGGVDQGTCAHGKLGCSTLMCCA